MSSTRDYFAELYVSAMFGDAGWSVYFPRRDVGFDFIATKVVGHQILIRPVQVKGRYPTRTKTDKAGYGFNGELTAVHESMVLAIPFFHSEDRRAPECVAFMPFDRFKHPSAGGYRCMPARFTSGRAEPRRDSRQYFGEEGLRLVEHPKWGSGA